MVLANLAKKLWEKKGECSYFFGGGEVFEGRGSKPTSKVTGDCRDKEEKETGSLNTLGKGGKLSKTRAKGKKESYRRKRKQYVQSKTSRKRPAKKNLPATKEKKERRNERGDNAGKLGIYCRQERG